MNPATFLGCATIVICCIAAASASLSAAPVAVTNTFSAGNPAVANDVNQNFTDILTGINKMNPNGWTLSTNDIGYTGGSLGVGIAAPTAKFNVVGGSTVTLASATGFGVFGATTGNHVAIDSTQIQAKSNPTTASILNLNPLGGNIITGGGSLGVGLTPTVKFHVAAGSAITLAGATGYGAFGATTGSHIAVDSSQIQAKGSATTSADLLINPLGGNVGIGTAPSVGFHVDNGNAITMGGATGFIVAGNTTSSHVAISNLGIQAKASATTSAELGLNPLGGTVNMGSIPAVSGVTKLQVSYPAGTDRGVLSFSTNATATNQTMFAAWTAANYNTQVDYFLGKVNATAGGAGTVNVRIRADGFSQFSDGASTCTINTGAPSMSCSSDMRLKKHIRIIDNALLKLSNIRGAYYSLRHNEKQSVGLIAQDVERVFPEVITHDERGMKMIGHNQMLGPIIAGINELKSEKDSQFLALEKRATTAEARAAKLERLLAAESQARKQQEIRLAQLEESLVRVAKRIENQRQVVAKK